MKDLSYQHYPWGCFSQGCDSLTLIYPFFLRSLMSKAHISKVMGPD